MSVQETTKQYASKKGGPRKITLKPSSTQAKSVTKVPAKRTDVTMPYREAEESPMIQLNEALQSFVKDPSFKDLNLNSTAKIKFSDFLSNKLLVVQVIRKGIPYSLFTVIQHLTPFTINDWASYLDLSGKSLIRYQQQDKAFKSIHTEKIIELAEVSILGLEIFGDNKKFKLWLETPNYALGNLKPFDLLRDSYGKEMIIGELTRIDHGILG